MYQRIKDLRIDNDKTQKQMAEILHMQVTQYRRYENADSELPFAIAISIAEFYNVSLDYLAGKTNDKKGLTKNTLSDEEIEIINIFNALTPREQGQLIERGLQLQEQSLKAKEVG